MNTLFALFLSAFAQDGALPAHASLHPADVDLYLEVPDVQDLLGRYETAPMVRTFREDSVRQRMAALRRDLSTALPEDHAAIAAERPR